MGGWSMTGDANAIVMRKGNDGIRFDIIIKTERGAIFATYITRRNVPELQGNMAVLLEYLFLHRNARDACVN